MIFFRVTFRPSTGCGVLSGLVSLTWCPWSKSRHCNKSREISHCRHGAEHYRLGPALLHVHAYMQSFLAYLLVPIITIILIDQPFMLPLSCCIPPMQTWCPSGALTSQPHKPQGVTCCKIQDVRNITPFIEKISFGTDPCEI